MDNTCFVIMPIGTQAFGDYIITEDKLKKKYDYIIKNAVLKANPSLTVIRSDEEFQPGSISNDIFDKLMHCRYVIADITYPNPNVFYELGIRHAIKPGTILIREKIDLKAPFDISHLRYIEYTQEIDGMDNLATQLKKQFDFYDKNPLKPDNQFLELCLLTKYVPSIYASSEPNREELTSSMLSTIFGDSELRKTLLDSSLSKEQQQEIFLERLGGNEEMLTRIISLGLKSGLIKL